VGEHGRIGGMEVWRLGSLGVGKFGSWEVGRFGVWRLIFLIHLNNCILVIYIDLNQFEYGKF
jgi:hypothetical protein